jgi:MoxR-like ATPase
VKVDQWTAKVIDNVESVIVGKRPQVELLIVSLLCRGHVLIEDVPGTGKTMVARSLAGSIALDFQRIQCTPDLLPNEVTGVNVLDQQRGRFEFRPGPVFTNVLLVDEINRATPRTQSALLEAMGEQQVSVDGVSRSLPDPFVVLATQNPIDHAGTFPLPEAQLDRFLLRMSMGYPDRIDEVTVLRARRAGSPIDALQPVAAGEDLPVLWAEVSAVHVDRAVEDLMLAIVRATRAHPDLAVGASVRGSLALSQSAQARAAMAGRDYVVPDDVKALAVATLAHRLLLRAESQIRERTAEQVMTEILDAVAVPVEQRSS